MQNIIPISLLKKSGLFLLTTLIYLGVHAQVPTQQQISELIPGLTEPTQMT